MPSDAVNFAFKSNNGSINAQWGREPNVDIPVVTGNTSITLSGTRCRLQFNIPENMGPPVLFYYYLTNFYQNHRRYVDSFDAEQLDGKKRSYDEIKSSKCDPLYGDKEANKPYFPCGLIANSMFNDTYSSPVLLNPNGRVGDNGNETEVYEMNNNTNIAWDSDKALYSETKYSPDDVLPPPNWVERFPDKKYSAENPPPNLEQWEAFQVWMRTAALPVFSKLYQRNDDKAMQEGRYELVIDYCTLRPSFRLKPIQRTLC